MAYIQNYVASIESPLKEVLEKSRIVVSRSCRRHLQPESN